MIRRRYERLSNGYDLHHFEDQDFQALICLNLKEHGTALGGTRYIPYANFENAKEDVLSLAEAMTHKAKISQVPFDGGKSVIIQRKETSRSETLKKFAHCVDLLEGQYISTIDSGTTPEDMSFLKQYTRFVTGDITSEQQYGATSDATAYGVHQGMRAAYQVYFNQGLQAAHIAIQGLGNVGYRLAKYLSEAQAKLSISDIKQELLQNNLKATIKSSETILSTDCDILAPCALGKVFKHNNLSQLKTKLIAGAANAQLASAEVDTLLFKKGIHYVPDFVINAGGLIHLALQYKNYSKDAIRAEVGKIYDRVYALCEEAQAYKTSILTVTKL